MHLVFHRRFKKQYKKLRRAEQARCDERLLLFAQNPQSHILEDHALSGELSGYRSINIGGDLRAQYEFIDKERTGVYFIRLGTHSELYGK